MTDDVIGMKGVFFFLGSRFKLPWSSIPSWAVTDVIVGDQRVGRILELHLDERRMQAVASWQLSESEFDGVLAEVSRRLAGKEGTSRLERSSRT